MTGCAHHRSLWALMIGALCGVPFIASTAHAQVLDEAEVRDSSGVRIVDYGILDGRIAHRVGSPTYHLGAYGSAYAFSWIYHGVLLSDGTAVIGDVATRELYFIDPSGEAVVLRGGPGGGPGEFGGLESITVVGGDTVVVEDDSRNRLSWYHGAELLRTSPFDHRIMVNDLHIIGWDGREMLMATWGSDVPTPGEWHLGHLVSHPLGTERFDTITEYRMGWAPPSGTRLNPLNAIGYSAFTEGALLTAWGADGEVHVRPVDREGSTLIRWTEPPRALTDSLWAEYLYYAELRGRSADARGAAARAGVQAPLPAIGGLKGDRLGRIWVAEFSADRYHPTRYRVFGHTGNWIGWVRMPPRTQILDIGTDAILAVRRDDFGVQSVVLLPLLPAG